MFVAPHGFGNRKYGSCPISFLFFEEPIRTVWVKHLAKLIEPYLSGLARSERAARLPTSLMALQLAESQIGLVAHWLTGRFHVGPAIVAEALVSGTRAQAAALLKRDAGSNRARGAAAKYWTTRHDILLK